MKLHEFNLTVIPSVFVQLHSSRGSAAALMPHSALFDEAEPLPPPARMLVVDAGYSFTHVIPVINGHVDHANIRR